MSIKDLSVTAANNNAAAPYGAPEGLVLSNVNNVMRQTLAEIRTLAAEDTIASATTCDLGTKDATFLTVSGTTTITGFGTVSAGIYKFVRFSGALTLTHNATSLILLTGANRTTVAGACGLYKSEGSGNWREYFYSAQGDYQPLDAQLTTLAGITAQQATDLAAVSTFMGTVLDDADAATARATLGVSTLTALDAWPVGSVFIAVVETNPNTLLGGGTWVAFGAGRVMVGFDSTQTEFDTVEETGGAKTHTLTTAEMPAHTHSYTTDIAGSTTLARGAGADVAIGDKATSSTGGGGAHNNLQPYIVCYFWKRTA